jgi:hypothetical protein
MDEETDGPLSRPVEYADVIAEGRKLYAEKVPPFPNHDAYIQAMLAKARIAVNTRIREQAEFGGRPELHLDFQNLLCSGKLAFLGSQDYVRLADDARARFVQELRDDNSFLCVDAPVTSNNIYVQWSWYTLGFFRQ